MTRAWICCARGHNSFKRPLDEEEWGSVLVQSAEPLPCAAPAGDPGVVGAATPGRRSNLCGGGLVVESRMVPFVGGQNRNDAWRRS
jgi:hypothetical protein